MRPPAPGNAYAVSLTYPTAPSGRRIRVLDALVAFWVAAWIVIGIFVAIEVRGLRSLSNTLVRTGAAISQTADALGIVNRIPLLGGQVGSIQRQVKAAAASAASSGRSSRDDIGDLSILLGVSIALIPSVPIAGLYAPLRIGRVREVRAVRRVLARAPDDDTFLEFLARRATQNLPYYRLREVSENPWRDLESGRYGALADAELARLGLRSTPTGRPAA